MWYIHLWLINDGFCPGGAGGGYNNVIKNVHAHVCILYFSMVVCLPTEQLPIIPAPSALLAVHHGKPLPHLDRAQTKISES